MKNRTLVLSLTVLYAAFVAAAAVVVTPAHLLGSALQFFTDEEALDRLASFDRDNDSVPDLVSAERILEIFVSAPQWLTPFMFPAYIPDMIRIDEEFFAMPDHSAAPEFSTESDDPAFDAVEPLWTSDEIILSPEFEDAVVEVETESDVATDDASTPYLVPSAAPKTFSPSSSLPASLTMPTMPSTPPAVTAPPSSTPVVTSAPPAVVPPTAPSTSSSSSSEHPSCADGLDLPDADGIPDDMDAGNKCDQVGMSSSSSSSADPSCTDGLDLPDADGIPDDMDAGTMCDQVGMTSGSTGF